MHSILQSGVMEVDELMGWLVTFLFGLVVMCPVVACVAVIRVLS